MDLGAGMQAYRKCYIVGDISKVPQHKGTKDLQNTKAPKTAYRHTHVHWTTNVLGLA